MQYTWPFLKMKY